VRLKTVEEKLRHAQLENRYPRELLQLVRIEKYGPGSEKLSAEPLALLELVPGVSQAESQQAPLKPPIGKAWALILNTAADPGTIATGKLAWTHFSFDSFVKRRIV
jgi:hypothetical protein